MASTEDKSITCVDCGEEFLFTAGEQAFYRERGLTNEPTRCKSCREKRKAGRAMAGGTTGGSGGGYGRSEKQMYPATCSNCGRDTEVPFMPTAGRPVLCRDCFNAAKGTGAGAGAGAGYGGGHGGGRGARGGDGARGGGGGGASYGRSDKQMYAAICSNCGRETEVPFMPTAGRPVLCRDCFNASKGTSAGAGAGAGYGAGRAR